jgi:putative inorganic carbon (HCO3(-)) transporter
MVSDSINPSVLAGSLVILLPYLIATLLWDQSRMLRRILLAVVIVLMLGAVVLSQSRGGWMGLSAALAVMILLRWRRGWLLLLAPFAAAAVVVWLLGIGRTADILTTDRTFGGLSGRKEVWIRAIYLIRDFPLTGIGMGAFQQMSGALYPFENPLWRIPHAHNIFSTVAADLGILGLIAWLAIIFVIIATAWQLYRHGLRSGDGLLAALGVGTVCSQVALLVHGLTDAVTWGMVRPAVLVWALWGLSMAAWRLAQVLPVASQVVAESTRERAQPSADPMPSTSGAHALTLRRRRP